MRIIAAIALAGVLLPGALPAQTAQPKKPPTAKEQAAAAAMAEAPAARPASTVTSTYKIGAGDQLEVYVWGDERLQRTLTVLPDGTFALPLAGTIMAAGRTPNQLESELARLLAPQYKGVAPQVTVSVRQTTGMQISVIGKVRAPGAFTPTRYLTLLDLLALCGGPTDFADVNNVVILRRVGDRSTVIHTRVGSVLKGKPSDAILTGDGNPLLQPGDTVVVP